jgi:hypothetical protein
LVRPELGGKTALLGFYGVCPNVEVGLTYLDQPAVLTFVFTGGPSGGSMTLTVDVIDEADNRVIASTGESRFDAPSRPATLLAPTLILIFGRGGQFAARCIIDGIERFRGRFGVIQGRPISE